MTDDKKAELKTGLLYPLVIMLLGGAIGYQTIVVRMQEQVEQLRNDNGDLKREIAKVKDATVLERKSRAEKIDALKDRVNAVDKTMTEVSTTLRGIQSGITDMKDDMRDMRKKLDRLERRG